MPYQPTLYNRYGEHQNDRSVRGWSVIDLPTMTDCAPGVPSMSACPSACGSR